MTAADLEAVAHAVGVAPLPHPLMPKGHSYFVQDGVRTTEVEKIKAKDLTLESLAHAMNRSAT